MKVAGSYHVVSSQWTEDKCWTDRKKTHRLLTVGKKDLPIG